MRVPTIDYSPAIRSNSERTQAAGSRFIAPALEYQRKSLELRKKSIDQKIGDIGTSEAFNSLNFALGMGKLGVKTAQMVESYQQEQAAVAVKKDMSDWQTEMLRRQASGEITMTENGINGLDGLNEYQEAQLANIDNQKWFGSVKKEAKEALKGFYSERVNAINQAIYRDTMEKKSLLEQDTLNSYINNDASRLEYTPEDAYRLTDNYINTRDASEAWKDLAKETSHKEIDWKRAENSVRVASQRSKPEGHAEADKIADEKKYDNTQRTQLHAIVDGTSRQMVTSLTSEGLNTMAQALQEGSKPQDIWNAIDDKTKNLGEEYKKAYTDGAKTAHLSYCNNIVAEIVQQMPETLTSADVQTAIESLQGASEYFEGIPEAKQLMTDTIAKWKEADQILVSEDYKEKYEAIKSIYLPHLLDSTVSANQVLNMIDAGMEKAKENGDNNKLAAYQQLTQDVIKTTQGEFINPAIKRAEQTISDTMEWYFGKDSFKGDPRVREMYNGIVKEADASLIDLCMSKGKLSDAEVDKIANDIMSKYANQESVVRAAAEGNGYVAKIQGKAKEETDEYTNEFVTDLATRLTSAIKAENSNKEAADKKHNFGDSETYEKNAATLEMIKKNSLPLIDKMISSMQPSNVDSFTDKLNDKYYLLKKDPNKWLDKFKETQTSDKNPWIDNPGKDYTVNVSNQNMNLFDKELEDMYPLVSGTQPGRDYETRRKELEQGMITYFMGYIGKPVDPDGWKRPIYSPDDGGFTYKNGDTIFRTVRYGNGFQVQTLDENNEWVTETPASKPYDNTTTEGVDQIVNKNTNANKKAIGYENANQYYNKETGEYQDTDPNKPAQKDWWWR